MKSSPKMNEMPASTGSKTPASAKKLVQARLPFKTLGGSEPPFTTSNDTTDVVLVSANTLSSDNRKRKQSTPTVKDDGVRAPKINRCDMKDNEIIILESSETMESDLSSGETENTNKNGLGHSSESKENVCVDKSGADDAITTDSRKETVDKADRANNTPKAKQSLEFDGERRQSRRSKKNESNIPKIKLPIAKKSKKNKKMKKPVSDTASSDDVSMEEDQAQETARNVDMVETVDSADSDDASESMEQEQSSDNNDSSIVADKSLLNESNASEVPTTPGNCKMTPKQIQRRLESEKKKQEKERAKIERERALQEEKENRQREKEERELQKKREREEKDEQRKKEKEKQLEEKQREKEMKEQQRKMEREEKEEQKKREREEKELQKKKEREEKEREKEEERKKRDEEKRQKMEAEQKKNRKTKEAFFKFFVPKKVDSKTEMNDSDMKMDVDQANQTFMSFQIKDDMKLAPVTRRTLNDDERSTLEEMIASNASKNNLYVSQLKNHTIIPRKTTRTWIQDDDDDKSSNDDLFIIDEIDSQGVQVMQGEPKKFYRAKFLKFHENRRPAFYGTWRKKSAKVRPRKPFGLDSRLEYEVDSDDEWEEEEPGESLHGSDDEKEAESEDEYEIDNEFFVPHGHLSDEELQNEDESENDPENLKVKLKLAQNEFEDERKKKTHKLKPRLIGLIWQTSDGSKPENCSNPAWDFMTKYAMLFNKPSVKVEPNNQPTADDDDESIGKSTPRRLQIGEKEIPDLIRLVHGNQNKSKFLTKEFSAYMAANHQPQREYLQASITSKIKELAKWRSCPEEGYKKLCWYVPIETRKRYGVGDLTFPNTWSYTLPVPRRANDAGENDGDAKPAENKDALKKDGYLSDVIMLSDDSNSCTLSETLTPELIKQALSKSNYNIAKFIRPLTQDEKKKQFEPITMHRRTSEDQLPIDMPSTSQPVEDKKKSTPVTMKRKSKQSSDASASKKRVNLLMSGPVGEELSPRLKSTLVTQFLSKNQKKRKSETDSSSTSTAGLSDGTKKSKIDSSVIVID